MEPKGICIYLAIPIDKASGEIEDSPSVYGKVAVEIANALDTNSIFSTIFLPGRSYCISGPHTHNRDSFVIGINNFALLESDVMVVLYSPGVESWGVPQEVDCAWRNDIPVIVFHENIKYAPDELPMYLRSKSTCTALGYKNLAEKLGGFCK